MKREGNILPLLELQVWLGVCIRVAVVRAVGAMLINSLFLRIYPLQPSSEKNEMSVFFCQKSNLAEITRISNTKLVLEPETGW